MPADPSASLSWAPADLVAQVTTSLQPSARAFGQVATVDAAGRAQVRTVHWRLLDPGPLLGFALHQHSPKWRELLQSGRCAGCWWNPASDHQLRWEGAVRLVTAGAVGEDRQRLETVWPQLRDQVRAAYWAQARGLREDQVDVANLPVADLAPGFGLAIVTPTMWESYDVQLAAYLKGVRRRFVQVAGQWQEQRLALVSSQPL